MAIEAYPLCWPAGWPRTKASDRARPRFTKKERVYSQHTSGSSWMQSKAISVYDAVSRVRAEIRKFGVEDKSVIVSTNIETRNDGWPRSDRRAPEDPGVAVYWIDPTTRQQQCMAIDLYDSVAGNLAAVAATIDAMRAIERHGGAQILKRAFDGFKALPAGGATTPTLSTGQAAHLVARLAGSENAEARAKEALENRTNAEMLLRIAKAKTHPDAGGSNEDWTLLQEAQRILYAHHGVAA